MNHTTSNNRVCQNCMAGQFSSYANAYKCTSWQTCSAGRFILDEGNDIIDRNCSDCAMGRYTSIADTFKCILDNLRARERMSQYLPTNVSDRFYKLQCWTFYVILE